MFPGCLLEQPKSGIPDFGREGLALGGSVPGLIDTFFNTDVMLRVLPMLLRGLVNTFYLAVAAIAIGTTAGILICIARLYGPKPVRILAVGFIDIFRALPILVVLIVIYYALPFVRIRLDSFTSATIALSIVLAAFTAEVFRAGIKSIPVGQFEAARALGLPFYVTLLKVVIPQAIRIATPPQTSNCISIVKDTSLASVVAMPDLLKQATDAQALTANPSPLIAAAAIYLIILWPLVRLVAYLEQRAA
jgi:polar amino acid transport system permease protein